MMGLSRTHHVLMAVFNAILAFNCLLLLNIKSEKTVGPEISICTGLRGQIQ